ncbi:heavy metal translocating P-type ATPase [Bradyrhizobium sp. AS23.2]|uniref:heavy metal translocating P-type ATPase n=1 Tax=Bradyrhizobium sp. AS23.2 TaxID=1680155 RepID=UPI001FD873B3|nr:heavy metal translocating P-type ATPase [Bradyrhizobium sp. AS23.2]
MATIDESAVAGEPIPVAKTCGSAVLSGSLNAGETFDLTVTAPAGESTYAGIVRIVTAAQTVKAPFVRLADRYALIFLPVTLVIVFLAWLISGDLTRSLAVLVAATPCPLILAAPVAFIAGVAQAARRGILVKGGGALEALARAHTVLVQGSVVMHEREDEGSVYPQLAEVLRERHGLSALSRAHREILHLARLLARIAEDLPLERIDRYLIRDAQRVIEAIETLVRMHTAQEDDIYEAVAAQAPA